MSLVISLLPFHVALYLILFQKVPASYIHMFLEYGPHSSVDQYFLKSDGHASSIAILFVVVAIVNSLSNHHYFLFLLAYLLDVGSYGSHGVYH